MPSSTAALMPRLASRMITNSPRNIVTTVSTICVYSAPMPSFRTRGVIAPKKSRMT